MRATSIGDNQRWEDPPNDRRYGNKTNTNEGNSDTHDDIPNAVAKGGKVVSLEKREECFIRCGGQNLYTGGWVRFAIQKFAHFVQICTNLRMYAN